MVQKNKIKKNLKTKKRTKSGVKYCSPNNSAGDSMSCFDYKALHTIAETWNKTNKDKIKIVKNRKKLWKNIEQKMSYKCNTEWCWINKATSSLKHKDHFKPLKPKVWEEKPNEWLDNFNLENVMKQYQKKYHDFEFIGPVPIDFDLKNNIGNCVVDELCKIQLSNLIKNNKYKLGIIFNLDKHNESGSHWIALYCDIKKSQINYFDSYGIHPEYEIKVLINKLHEQLTKHNNKCIIEINEKRHQYKGSECGVYCLHFLITMITQNIEFDDFCGKHMPDNIIFNYRKQYFIS